MSTYHRYSHPLLQPAATLVADPDCTAHLCGHGPMLSFHQSNADTRKDACRGDWAAFSCSAGETHAHMDSCRLSFKMQQQSLGRPAIGAMQ